MSILPKQHLCKCGKFHPVICDEAPFFGRTAIDAERDRLRLALDEATKALEEVSRDHARDRASYRRIAREALTSIAAILAGQASRTARDDHARGVCDQQTCALCKAYKEENS